MLSVMTDSFQLPEHIEQYDRKKVLFDYAEYLANCGYPEATITIEISEANSTRCSVQLNNDEVQSIAEAACRYANTKDDAKFVHDAFGNMLIYRYHVCILNGSLMIWRDGRYRTGSDEVARIATELRPSLKIREIHELMSYLLRRATQVDASNSRYISFANCVLDLETGITLPNSPDLHIPNTIPHQWNPGASCSLVDVALDQWSCGRNDISLALCETIGLCLYRGEEYQSGTFLTGKGANGKSTFLDMLMNVIGTENVSSLDIWSFGERFQTTALMGKLANLGDDIASERLSGKTLAIAKKVMANNWVSAEIKGGETFKFKPYCHCIFSCNRMPRLGDNSEGVYRRFRIIPFLASFTQASGNHDGRIGRKLATEEAAERAIVLGITALMQALQRGYLTSVAEQDEMIDAIRKDNSSVYQFACEELGYGASEAIDILGWATTELFEQYKVYADNAGLRAVSRNTFSTEMCQLYDIKTAKKRIASGEVAAVFTAKDSQL